MAENRPVVIYGKLYSWQVNEQGRLSLVEIDAEVQDLVRSKLAAEFGVLD